MMCDRPRRIRGASQLVSSMLAALRMSATFLVTVSLVAGPGSALAQGYGEDDDDEEVGLQTYLRGFIRSDIRYQVPKFNPFWCKKGPYCHGSRSVGDIEHGFSRNENLARMAFGVRSGPYKGIAEIDFVWTGFSRSLDEVSDLSRREKIDPFRLEAHALYFEITNFLTRGLDVRVGKQIVTWGKADMFNPTSNLNPLDLEDVLLFGDRVSNNMIRMDYSPWMNWIFSLVWVPVFKPHQLPESAVLAVKGVDRIPIVEDSLRRRLHTERDFAGDLLGLPTVVTQANPELPDLTIGNSQVGFRAAGKVAKMDLSLSYYYGRSKVPQPYIEHTFGGDGFVDARTSLMYPRMHVIGMDWAGQIPLGKLGGGNRGIGFWLEMAVFFPQKVHMPIYQYGLPVPDGEYDYDGDGNPGGLPPTIVDSRPFAKWVLGFDYTFNKYVFMNVQWVHGFPDEFGAGDWLYKSFVPTRGRIDLDTNNDGQDDLDYFIHCSPGDPGAGDLCAKEVLRPRLGDYLVAGLDMKFLSERLFIRLFFILDITGIYIEEFVRDPGASGPAQGHRRRTYHHAFSSQGFNMILYPQVTWSVGHGIELMAGGLLSFGRPTTKFGDTATGGSLVFLQGKFSF